MRREEDGSAVSGQVGKLPLKCQQRLTLTLACFLPVSIYSPVKSNYLIKLEEKDSLKVDQLVSGLCHCPLTDFSAAAAAAAA